jgi:hypothetical protein
VKTRAATLVLLAAAVTAVPVASGTSRASTQRVALTAKTGVDQFVLTPLGPGPLGFDSGGVNWCCWSQRSLVRDGQSVEINDPRATFTGRRGTFVVRFRIEWLDAGNGYAIGISTWKVVRGTGAYASVTGGGRGASSWLPRGPVSFQAEGFLVSR